MVWFNVVMSHSHPPPSSSESDSRDDVNVRGKDSLRYKSSYYYHHHDDIDCHRQHRKKHKLKQKQKHRSKSKHDEKEYRHVDRKIKHVSDDSNNFQIDSHNQDTDTDRYERHKQLSSKSRSHHKHTAFSSKECDESKSDESELDGNISPDKKAKDELLLHNKKHIQTNAVQETLDYNFDFTKYKHSLGKVFFRENKLSVLSQR